MTQLNNELVSDALLARYAELIYDRTGIRISEQKKMLLSNRLRRRLRATGIAGFEEYFRHLQRLSAADPEWDAFLEEITTHETYLFRDEAQWNWFRSVYLPDIAGQAAKGSRRRSLRIWSAACSTGDEAMTVACCIAAAFPNLAEWKIQIVGTDIGVGALERAQAATFGERAMKLVPGDLKSRFFQSLGEGKWQAKPVLRSMARFSQHNLTEPLREPPFDLVILKNVLIYFDAQSKQKVIENVRKVLLPGGLLLAGGSEGVSDQVKDFDRIQPWLYAKPRE